MKVLVTSNSHPHYNEVAELVEGKIPPNTFEGIDKELHMIQLKNGDVALIAEDQYKPAKINP